MTDQTEPKVPQPEAAPPSPSGSSNEEFARLLASSTAAKELIPGAVVKGTIVSIGDADALVDVGGKSEAIIARAELLADDGTPAFKVGDVVEATVVIADGTVRLSRRITGAAKGKEGREKVREMLMEAFRSHLPVQGRVTASIKGGYEVQVAGMRGFCPFSQIDIRRQEDPTLYFNKTFDFLIKEFDPRKRNLILSRRALIEAEQKKNEAAAREQIQPGAVLTGTVVSLQDFGAFIDLGSGIEGLLHVSEISHARVGKPSDVLSIGQTLQTQVLRVDRKKGKISLTRKPLEADPWSGVAQRFPGGRVLQARVVRTTEFGAFLELAPGIDGLLHVSEMSGRGGAPVKPGDELKVAVLKVDEGRRRVSLGLATDGAAPGDKVKLAPLAVGDVVTGKVERVEKFGVFVRIGPGRSGMVPNNELGTPKGSDHRRMFPVGTELTAEVIQADPGGRKIRLSVEKAAGREEREAVARYRKDSGRTGSSSFSTLADAFAALKKTPPRNGEAG